MEEGPLILFTLLLQAACGAAWILAGLTRWLALRGDPAGQALAARGWPAIAAMAVLGLVVSGAHLGVPLNAWRAASNWRSSWLSREILAAAAFTGAALAAGSGPLDGWGRALALLCGPVLLLCMANAYRLGPVPAWNSWLTPAAFGTTALLLGTLAVGGILAGGTEPLRPAWAMAAMLLMVLSLALTGRWLAGLPAAMRAHLLERHRCLLLGRLLLALAGLGAATLVLGRPGAGPARLAAIAAMAGAEGLGRALFYAGHLAHGVYGCKS
jgi:anaerobic dimethyl sulfoxide reductase subunit C (anchor subunit)